MSQGMRNITIVGLGNVGTNLLSALLSKKLPVTQVLTNSDYVNPAITVINDYGNISQENLVILAVPDNQIAQVLTDIPTDIAVVYTSGAVELNNLPQRKELGVFYPLQTFSKYRSVEFDNIPMLIEANSSSFEEELKQLAKLLSNNVRLVDSTYRKKLHLSAVFINNFTNHIIHIAEKKAIENNVDFELLKPLLRETIDKLSKSTAYDAQTGPARRNDQATINSHIELLNGLDKEVYKTITQSIIQTYFND